MTPKKSDIGLIGLAVMGANLARNLASKKIPTIVFNRTKEKTEKFIEEFGNSHLTGELTLKKFTANLSSPKKIIIMVQAGDPVDAVIKQLLPYLKKNDIIIDCGNSNYKDTQRRHLSLKQKNIGFIGCGVSGGEEGALNGPSIMPGGNKSDYKKLEPILKKIAAKDFNNKPAVTHVGENGAGHFVKTVHNGIEYGVMQIMAEGYDILRKVYKLKAPQIAKIFEKYNKGVLSSYLFEISVKVLNQKDEFNNGHLLDYILDKAAQKGTGKWTAISALENEIALPSITEAVFARLTSGEKEKRLKIAKLYSISTTHKKIPLKQFEAILEKALYAAMLSTYAQGYELISKVSKKENWKIDLSEVSRIWEGGCIIRAKILNFLHKAYKNKADKHLFEIPEVQKPLKSTIKDLRTIVALATEAGISTPSLATSLTYFEAMTTQNSPANFIQGLRDYFGAHTYERTDKKGSFHTNWE